MTIIKNIKSNITAKKKFSFILGASVSMIFLMLFMRKIDWSLLLNEIYKVDLLILGSSLIFKFFGFVFMTLRSSTILSPLFRFNFQTVFSSVALAFTGNNLLPLRMGELLRIKYLADSSKLRFVSCLPALVFERLLDAVCLVILLVLIIPIISTSEFNLASIYVLFVGLALLFLFLRYIAYQPNRVRIILSFFLNLLPEILSEKFTAMFDAVFDAVRKIYSPRRLLVALFYSLLYWLTQLLSIYVWIIAFDLKLAWYSPLIILVFLSLGNFLPSAPSNIGIYHYFMMTALTMLSVKESVAASIAIVGHGVSVIPFTILFLPLCLTLFSRTDLKKAKNI